MKALVKPLLVVESMYNFHISRGYKLHRAGLLLDLYVPTIKHVAARTEGGARAPKLKHPPLQSSCRLFEEE